MARVNVYSRHVDAVLTSSTTVNHNNQTEIAVKIKVEPPEIDGENPNESSATKGTNSNDDSDKSHNDKTDKDSAKVPPANNTVVLRTGRIATIENKQLTIDPQNWKIRSKKRKRKKYSSGRTHITDKRQHRKKPATNNDSIIKNSSYLFPEKIIICDLRDVKFRRKHILQDSKDTQLKDERLSQRDLYICSVCSVLFDSVKLLEYHIQRYTSSHWYVCPECNSRFYWINDYKKHIHVCQRTEQLLSLGFIKYSCNFCNLHFRFKNTLQSHIFHYHYEEICPPERTQQPDDAVAEEASSSLPPSNATDILEAGKMTPKRPRSDDDQLSTPSRKMRQTMLTEFLQSSAKKQKLDDDSSKVITEEDVTKNLNDNEETAMPSNGESDSSTLVNGSKKPFVQIHVDSEVMSFLMNSTVDIKNEFPEDCPSTDVQDSSRKLRTNDIAPSKSLEESLSNDQEHKKKAGSICETPKHRRTRQKTTNNNLKNMFNCKAFSIPLVRCEYMLKEKLKTRRSSLSSQVSSMSSVSRDLQEDKSALELKNLAVPLIRLNNSEELSVKENNVNVSVKNEPTPDTTSEREDNKTFQCKVCKKSFNLKENLQEHMNLFHVAYMSSICKARYTSKSKLLEHYLHQHMIFDRSKCCICQKKYEKRVDLKKHLAVHCIKIVRSQKDNLPINVEMKCNIFRKLHKCKECGKKFWLSRCLKQHLMICHKRERSMVMAGETEINPLAISTSSPMKQPTQALKSPNRDQMNIGYLNNERLDQSLMNTTANTDLPSQFSETESRILTNQKSQQDTTEFDARGVEKWVYPCNVCGRQFQTLANLYTHQRTFAKPANKRCNICGTCFTTKRHLQTHVTATHALAAMPEQYKYRCRFCNQGFLKKGNQTQHEAHFHSADQLVQPTVHSNLLNPERLWNVNTVCTICNLMFESYDRFIEHNMYYYKGQIFTCTFCGQTFHGMYMLHHHNKLVHYPEETLKSYTYTCDICNEGFNHESHFHAHKLHVHLNETSMAQTGHRSREGEKYLPLAVDANVASSVETKQIPINAFTCAICELNFTNAKDLSIHKMEYSTDGEYQCNKCERRCSTYSVLKKHQSLNHTGCDIHNSYKCRFCGEVMTTNVSMMCHEKHFHMNNTSQLGTLEELVVNATKEDVDSNNVNDDNLACLTCGMRFKDEMDLKYHFLEYSDIGEHVCKVCHRRFAELHRLEIHKLKHSRLNNILSGHHCPICHEGFTSVTHVRTHVLHLHGHETFPNVFVKRANSNNNNVALVRETDVHLPENTKKSPSSSGADNSKVFSTDRFTGSKCPVCNLTFSDEKKLARHRLRYINDGNYICEFCGRRFCWETAFLQHRTKHLYSDERCVMKHRCPRCSEKFRTALAAHAHLVHIHNKDTTVDELKDLEKLMDEAGLKDMRFKIIKNHTEETISDQESELDDVLPGDVIVEKTYSNERRCSIESSCSSSKTDENDISIIEKPSGIIKDTGRTPSKSLEISKPTKSCVTIPDGPQQGESSRGSEYRPLSYVCPICAAKLPCLRDFQLHFSEHHEKAFNKPKTKPSAVQSDVIKCMFCESSFKHEANFKTHIESVHMPRMQKNTPVLTLTDDIITTPTPERTKSTPEDVDAIEILWEKKDDDLEVIEISCAPEERSSETAQGHPAKNSQSTLSDWKDRESTSGCDNVGKLKVKPFAKIIENLAQGSRPVTSSPGKQRSPKITNVIVVNDQDKIDNNMLSERAKSIDARHQAYLQTFLSNMKQ